MKAKTIFKSIFLVAILGLLVFIGINNRETVHLSLPRMLNKSPKLPAGFVYPGFFAAGLLSGAILMAGKKGGGAPKSKPKD